MLASEYTNGLALEAIRIIFKYLPQAYDDEKIENLIKAIDELKAKVDMPKDIASTGISEKDFYASLDEMCEQAFDDQCTGANPRYQLISEIKEVYINTYKMK